MAAAIPYALMIGGTVLQQRAAQQQGDEQRSELNQALGRTQQTQQKANTQIEAQASNLAPIDRAAALDALATANTQQSKAELGAAGATDAAGNAIINTDGDHGAVSKDFITAKADRALQEGNRLSAIAQQLAKTRSVGQLQQNEGEQRANLTQALSSLWDTTKNENDANQITAGGIQPPAYGTLGSVASTVGSVWAGKNMGKGLGAKKKPGGTIWAGGDSGNDMGGYV